MAQPKNYLFKFIEPGIISYKDKNAGTVLVSKEALDRMSESFKGCPIIFISELHDDSDKENSYNFEDGSSEPRQGIITGKPYWEDGWQWIEGIVWDEETQNALDNAIAEQAQGKIPSTSCSCSYMTDEEGEGGVWHELPYDAEVVNGHYMHMAIVPRPRYEGSRVFANSKGGPNLGINLFKKKNAAAEPEPGKVDPAKVYPAADPAKDPAAPAAAEPEQEGKQIMNDDAEVPVDGVNVPLHELVANHEEMNSVSVDMPIDDTDEVSLSDGTTATIAELKESWRKKSGGGEAEAPDPAMTNSADADADDAGGKDTDPAKVKANSAPAKKTVNKALQNAASSGDVFAVDTPMTKTERAALGRARYGLGNKKGGEA